MSSVAQCGDSVGLSRTVLDDLPPTSASRLSTSMRSLKLVWLSPARAPRLARLAASHTQLEHYSARVMRRERRVP